MTQGASVPQTINFQGRLSDSNNNPRTGTYSFTFRLFDSLSGGTQLPAGGAWLETQSISVTNGVFNAVLGSVTPIPYATFGNNAAVYLEVTVGGETLTPRETLVTSPFAFNAQTLSGKTFDAFVDSSTAQIIGGVKTFTSFPQKTGSLVPANPQDFITKSYVDTGLASLNPSSVTAGAFPTNVIASSVAAGIIVPASLSAGVYNNIAGIGTQTQTLDMNGNRVLNVGTPSGPADAATKSYVDTTSGASSTALLNATSTWNAQQTFSQQIDVSSGINVSGLISGNGNAISNISAAAINAGVLGPGVRVSSVSANSITSTALAAGAYAGVTGVGGQTQTLDMNSNRIINLPTPGAPADAATKAYVDATSGASLAGVLNSTNSWTAQQNFGNQITVSSGLVVNNGGVISGNGSGLTSLNPGNLTAGTLPTNVIASSVSVNSVTPSALSGGNYSNITGVGIITNGNWNGSVISAQYGGTGANLSAGPQGAIPYFSANGVLGGMTGVGFTGQVLQSNGTGAPTWVPFNANSSLSMFRDGVFLSSSTALLRLNGNDFNATLQGSGTTYLSLNPGATYFIQNTSTLQSGSVFNVSSGTVGNLIVSTSLLVPTPSAPNDAATKAYVDGTSGANLTAFLGSSNTWTAQQTYSNQLTVSSNVIVAGTISGNGSGLTNLPGGNLNGTIPSVSIDGSSVTKQGNVFNGANQLVQLNGGSQLPVASGANLTNLTAASINSGTLGPAVIASSLAVNSVTPTNVSAGSYGDITGIGLLGQSLNLNNHLINNVATPLSPADAATKAYVDLATASINGSSLLNSTNTFTAQQTFSNQIFVSSNVVVSGTVSGNGSGLTNLTAGNISAGSLGAWVVTSSVAANSITPTALVSGAYPPITGIGVQSQVLNMNSHAINNLATPSLATDAATKNYVDLATASINVGSLLNSTNTFTAQQIFQNQITVSSNVLVSGTVSGDGSGLTNLTAGNISAGSLGAWVVTSSVAANSITPTALASGAYPAITGVGSLTQVLNMNSHAINNVATPSLATDAATKGYVDLATASINASSLLSSTNTFTAQQTFNNQITVSSNVVVSGTLSGNGSGLTNLTAANISAGALGGNVMASSVAANAVTPTALTAGTYPAITGLGVQSQTLNMNSHLISNVTSPAVATDAANKSYVDAATAAVNTSALLNSTSTFTAPQVFIRSVTLGSSLTVTGALLAGGNLYPATQGSGGQFLQTDGFGNLSWQAASSGGGVPTLAVYRDGVEVSSPTGIIKYSGNDFVAQLQGGATAFIALNPNTTNYIHNSSALQPSTVLNISSGAVDTLTVGTSLNLPLGSLAPASLSAGALPSTVYASSISAGTVFPQALQSTTYSNILGVGTQLQPLNMNSHPINNVTSPTNPNDAATKSYVDLATATIGGAAQLNSTNTFTAQQTFLNQINVSSNMVVNSGGIISGNGSGLTNLIAGNIDSGFLGANVVASSVAANSVTPTALLSGVYPNISGIGAQSVALNMNSHLINNVTTPSAVSDAATKGYVDLATASINATAILNSTNTFTAQQVFNRNITVSSVTSTGGLTVGGQLIAGSGNNVLTTVAGLLDATKLTGLVPNTSMDVSSITQQGNFFNGNGQLVQLNGGGALPAVSGANLTTLTAANISAGTLGANVLASSVAANSVTPTALLSGAYPNITGVGVQTQVLNMNNHQINGLSTPSLAADAASKGYVDAAAYTSTTTLVASTNTWTAQQTFNNQITVTSNVVVNGSGVISGNGSGITNLTAGNLTGTISTSNIDSSSVTKQGNVFNGNSQLVQLNGSGALPSLSGANLTSLTAGGISAGSLGANVIASSISVNAVYPAAVVAGNYGINVSTATNLAGGATGSLPYQSAFGTTGMLAAGSGGSILTISNGVPVWSTALPNSSTSYIQNTNTLQAGTTFYVSSGTAVNLYSTSLTVLSSVTLPGGVYSPITGVGIQGQALNMGSHLINNVTTPSTATDAATKGYVDLATASINGTALLNSTNTFTAQQTFNNQITVSSNLVVNSGGVINGNGSGITNLTAGNLTGTISNSNIDSSSVTKQGNVFNGNSQLVQLTGAGALPALSGVNLTALTAANISAGSLGLSVMASSVAANSITPTALLSGVYANITGAGTQSVALNMNSHLINNVTTPSAASDAATKAYVDLATASINGTALLNSTNTFTAQQVFNRNITVSSVTSTGGLTVGGQLTAGAGNNIVTTVAGLLDAFKLTGLVPNTSIDASSITQQGNIFNGNSQLVQLTGAGALPALSGANLTALTAANISAGSLGLSVMASSVAANSITPTALLSAVYPNVAGVGTQSVPLNMNSHLINNVTTPSVGTDAANKSYVDLATASINGTALLNSTNTWTAQQVFNRNIAVSSVTSTGGLTVGGQITVGSGNNLVTTVAGLLDATKLTGLVPNMSIDASSITQQGNVFNGNYQLVQLNGSGALPTVSGANLTSLTAANISAGTLGLNVMASSVAANSITPTALLSAVYPNVTGVGAQSVALNMNSHLINNVTTPSVGTDAANKSYVDLATASINGSALLNSTNTWTAQQVFNRNVTVSSVTSTGGLTVGGQITAGSGNNLVTTAAGLLDATKLTGLVPNTSIDASSITQQGNVFNGNSQLVQLNGSGALPALSGANVTTLTAANISAGTLGVNVMASSVAANSITPTALLSAIYPNVTGVGAQTVALNMNSHLINNVTAPSVGTDAANKSYVDLATASINGTALLNSTNTWTAQQVFNRNVTVSSMTSTGGLTVGGQITAGSGNNVVTTVVGLLDATKLTGLVPNTSIDASSITQQGNVFNGNSQLVQLTGAGALPTVSGANLTALMAANISAGTLGVNVMASSVAANSITPTALLSSVYPNITGVGTQSVVLNMNSHLINNVTTPSAGTDAANKSYVDLATASINSTALLNSTNTWTAQQVFNRNVTVSSVTSTSGLTVGGQITAGSGNNVVTTVAGLLDATKLTGLVPNTSIDASSITQQGSVFNGNGQLVQLNGSGALPALSGANLTALTAANISAGTLGASVMASSVAANSVTPTALLSGVYPNITGVGTQSVALNMNSHLISNVTTPSSASDAATKGYVDLATASINTGAIFNTTNTWTAQQTHTAQINISSNIVVSGGGVISGNGSGITNLTAGDITGTISNSNIDSSSVTKQGNVFNGNSQLVQLTGGGALPALSGVNLTALIAANISAGTLGVNVMASSVAANSVTPTALLSAAYPNIAGVGNQTQGLNMNSHQINGLSAPALATDAATKGYADSAAYTSTTTLVASTNTWSAQQTFVNQITVTSNVVLTGGQFTGSGAGLTNLTASNIIGTISNSSIDSSSVTKQGNVFNGNSQLVQLNGSGALPGISGANLTALTAANISAGTLGASVAASSVAANSITPTALLSGVYPNITGVGTQSVALNMNSHLINNVTTPSSASDAATKGYVDLATASINGTALLNSTNTFTAQQTFNNQITVSSNVVVNGGGVIAGNGSGITNLTAGSITGTISNSNIDSSSVTKQGNVFNGNSQLVQLTGAGALPAVSGANLTALTAANINAGTLGANVLASSVAANSVTPTALLSAAYSNIAGVGNQTQGLNMNSHQINGLSTPALATDAATKGYVDASAGSSTATLVASTNTWTAQQSFNNQITVSSNLVVNGGGVISGNGSGLTSLTAGNITGAISNSSIDSSSVTKQGNAFNGNNQLVQLNGSGALPGVSGANLTTLTAANISAGTLGVNVMASSVAANSVTPTALLSATYPNITGVGNQTQALNMNSHLINNVTTPSAASDAATKGYVDLATSSINSTALLNSTNTWTAQQVFNRNVTVSSVTSTGGLAVGGQITAGSGNNVITTVAGLVDATRLAGLVPNASIDASSITQQGDVFNGNSQLVQLTGAGALPTVSGANLTALTAANISAGTLGANVMASSVAANSITPTALLSGMYPNITAVGTQSVALNMNSHQINGLSTPALATDAATKGYVDLATASINSGAIFNTTNTWTAQQTHTAQINISSNVVVNGGGVISGNGSGITNVTAGNIIGTISNSNIDSSSVTKQGNVFNGNSQLVQLTGAGTLPALSGANLTALTAANISAGTLGANVLASSVAANSVTPTALLFAAYPNITGVGAQTQGLNMNSHQINGLSTPALATDAATKGYVDSAAYTSTTTLVASTNTWSAQQTFVNQITVTSNVVVTGGQFTGSGAGLTNLIAGSITGTISNSSIDSSSVTKQGNAFNGNSQLVQLNGSGALPALTGANLTTLTAANISAGTLGMNVMASSVAANSITPTALLSGVYPNITGVGTQSVALNMNGHLINNVTTPSAASDAATKGYVDLATASINGTALLNSTNTWTAQQTFNNQIMVSTSLVVNGPVALATTSGSVGVGTQTPAAKLDVNGTTQLRNAVYISSASVGFDEYGIGNSGTSFTVNWGNSNKQLVTITGNVTSIAFTNPTHASNLVLHIYTGAGGNTVAGWPASVKWSGGTVPTITSTAGKHDILAFYFDGSTYYAVASQNF